MNSFPESGRRVGHVLLDAVVAYVPGGDADVNARSTNLALEAIADVDGALVVSACDDGNLNVNASGLMGGAMVTVAQLVERLAEARGTSREEIIAEMRAYLDS
jgi:hypothetical protein